MVGPQRNDQPPVPTSFKPLSTTRHTRPRWAICGTPSSSRSNPSTALRTGTLIASSRGIALAGTKADHQGCLQTEGYFSEFSFRVSIDRAARTTAQPEERAGRGDHGRAVGHFGLRSSWVALHFLCEIPCSLRQVVAVAALLASARQSPKQQVLVRLFFSGVHG